MDLLMYFVIVVVFLVSLFSLMYINSKFRVGKTFEEVQAEKKQFADKLYGSNHGKNQKKTNRKVFNKKVSSNRGASTTKNVFFFMNFIVRWTGKG